MSAFYLDEHSTFDPDVSTNNASIYDSQPASPTHPTAPLGNGLGSLADELAAAWSDDEDDDEDEEEEADKGSDEEGEESHNEHNDSRPHESSVPKTKDARLSNGTTISSTSTSTPTLELDMQDLGDFDTGGIPASLQIKMNEIEMETLKGLAMTKGWRRTVGMNSYESKMKDANNTEEDEIKRLMTGLQDLKSQSAIESGSQRYIYAPPLP